MKSFVLDENINDSRLAENCNREAKCVVERFPHHLKGKKDPEILPILLNDNQPLITMDATIVEQHRQYIPISHPGIIVVRLKSSGRTITTRIAATILSKFKSKFDEWPNLDITNLKIDITECGIIISSTADSYDVQFIKYDDIDFRNSLLLAINEYRSKQSQDNKILASPP